MPNREGGNDWKHPIALRLLSKHEDAEIEEAIEQEVSNLFEGELSGSLAEYRNSDRALMFPIEKIVSDYGVRVDEIQMANGLSGSLSNQSGRYTIKLHSNSNFRHRRFTLAHEMGHLLLRRITRGVTLRELEQARNFAVEEELLCDLFASMILMPKEKIEGFLGRFGNNPRETLLEITNAFGVSISAASRRLSRLLKSDVWFWDTIKNPKGKCDEEILRIKMIYPNRALLSRWYVPLYCSAKDHRFKPNLIEECYMSEQTKTGFVKITDLGSLDDGVYKMVCVFIAKREGELFADKNERAKDSFYSVISFVNWE